MMKKLLFIALLIFSLTGNCFAANISNADIDDEDMADITDWTDADGGSGASTQATFDSKSTMKLLSGTAGCAQQARRNQDIGTFGTRTVFSLNVYCATFGTQVNNDVLEFQAADGTTILDIEWASDGLWTHDGASWVEIGTNLVVEDTWQEWTFDVNWTAQTMNVYLAQVLTVSNVDISQNGAWANGLIEFYGYGCTTASQLFYIDWFKAGSDFTTRRRMIIFE